LCGIRACPKGHRLDFERAPLLFYIRKQNQNVPA
jgi:hypothetical protein